jgi:hypothetical protein
MMRGVFVDAQRGAASVLLRGAHLAGIVRHDDELVGSGIRMNLSGRAGDHGNRHKPETGKDGGSLWLSDMMLRGRVDLL